MRLNLSAIGMSANALGADRTRSLSSPPTPTKMDEDKEDEDEEDEDEEEEEEDVNEHEDEVMHGDQLRELRVEEMKDVFSKFDEDGDGAMESQSLQNALKSMDRELTDEDVAHLMAETNLSGGGEIDFEDFKQMVGKIKGRFIEDFEVQLCNEMGKALENMSIADLSSSCEDEMDEEEVDSKENSKEKEISDLQRMNNQQMQQFSALKLKYDDLAEHEKRMEEEVDSLRVLAQKEQQLQAKHDDLLYQHGRMKEELNLFKTRCADNAQLLDQNESLKAKLKKMEMERAVLMEQLDDFGSKGSQKGQQGQIEDLQQIEDEEAQRLLMETVTKMTRQKNELEAMLEEQSNRLKEAELAVAALRKQLSSSERERETLSFHLDEQQKLMASLSETARKREQELADRLELLETVELQKAYILRLQTEKEDLVALKQKDDQQMMMELEMLRNAAMNEKGKSPQRQSVVRMRGVKLYEKWNCGECSYFNQEKTAKCKLCGADKPKEVNKPLEMERKEVTKSRKNRLSRMGRMSRTSRMSRMNRRSTVL